MRRLHQKLDHVMQKRPVPVLRARIRVAFCDGNFAGSSLGAVYGNNMPLHFATVFPCATEVLSRRSSCSFLPCHVEPGSLIHPGTDWGALATACRCPCEEEAYEH